MGKVAGINMNAIIYAIKNLVTGDYYIGSSSQIGYRRFIQHRAALRANRHCNRYLQNAWNKHGEENFEFIILARCPKIKEAILFYEQYFIDLWRPKYNLCPIAGTRLGYKHTNETKRKIRDAHRNKTRGPLSTETKYKLSISNGGSNHYAAKLTEDKVLKIRHICATTQESDAQIGKMFGVARKTINNIRLRRTWRRV